MHAKMHTMLAAVGGRVDAVFYCPHAPDEGCRCRKPEPGLFEQIAERYSVELGDVPAVGDSQRDLVAAVTAGCVPHLVMTGKAAALRDLPLPESFPATAVVHQDLAAFAEYLIGLDARPSQAADL
jgi:D-glycero-D-manno-heptose 1,7-bisphosphate phosphatase